MSKPRKVSNVLWDNRVDRILHSTNALERRHLYLGRSQAYGYPAYLDRKLLHLHAWIHGGSGSRKTSLSFATLITQLIAGESKRRRDWLESLPQGDPNEEKDERCSVLVLDLKGDLSLAQNCYAEAKAAGLPFEMFTNVIGQTSHVFNPLNDIHLGALVSANQQCQTLLQAMSAEYGAGYGPSFFSAMNEIVLLSYMQKFGTGHSFRRLYELLSNESDYPGLPSDWKNARHLPALAGRLAGVHPLNFDEEDLRARPEVAKNEIRLPDMLRKSKVVYFFLSPAVEKTSVSTIAKLVLYCLFAAAAKRAADAKHRVYIFIDEFQLVVSANMTLLLEQARSMDLSFILAHQNVGQLKADRGAELVDTVESCVGFEQAFKVAGVREMERIKELSGNKSDYAPSWDDESVRWNETIAPRLSVNDLIEASAAPFTSLVRFSEGSGLSQFSGYWQPVVGEFHIAEDEYRLRQRAGWPDLGPGAITVEPIAAKPHPYRRRSPGSRDES